MLLSAIRSGIGLRVRATGLDVHTRRMATPSIPSAIVQIGDIDYHSTMSRGSDTLEVTVEVIVGRADEGEADNMLDAYASGHGSSSVITAIETSVSGDGLDEAMIRCENARLNEKSFPDGQDYVTRLFTVTVTVSGTT